MSNARARARVNVHRCISANVANVAASAFPAGLPEIRSCVPSKIIVARLRTSGLPLPLPTASPLS